MFRKVRDTLLRVPIIRMIVVCWGLYWGPPMWGNYLLEAKQLQSKHRDPGIIGDYQRGLEKVPHEYCCEGRHDCGAYREEAQLYGLSLSTSAYSQQMVVVQNTGPKNGHNVGSLFG